MKRVLFTICLVAGASFWTYAQQEEEVKFDGQAIMAKKIEIPYPTDVVEKAIQDRLGKQGVKPKSKSGWNVYSGVNLDSLGEHNVDLYTKLDRKSKKEKDATTGYYFWTKHGEPPTKENVDNAMNGAAALVGAAAAGAFIGNVAGEAGSTFGNRQIMEQEGLLKDEQKKLDRLKDDQQSLESKIKNLQQDLSDNMKKQKDQSDRLLKVRSDLEALKAKKL